MHSLVLLVKMHKDVSKLQQKHKLPEQRSASLQGVGFPPVRGKAGAAWQHPTPPWPSAPLGLNRPAVTFKLAFYTHLERSFIHAEGAGKGCCGRKQVPEVDANRPLPVQLGTDIDASPL